MVIESGATDQVTVMPSQFQSYNPWSHGSVKFSKGIFKQVAEEGSINVLPNLSLSCVLHIPQFSFDLLHMSSQTK